MDTTKEPFVDTKRPSRRRAVIKSFKARMDSKRSFTERLADNLTALFGTVGFLILNAAFFFVWLVWNTNLIPGLPAADPFPFSLLTTVVSLEAIFLAVIVLISQNREGRIADVREEMELYVDTYAEDEITKIMYLLTLILEKNGIDISKDRDLREMLQHLPSAKIEEELTRQLG